MKLGEEPGSFITIYLFALPQFAQTMPQKGRHTVTGIARHALLQGEEQNEHFQRGRNTSLAVLSFIACTLQKQVR